ncbi:MAG: nuclear transport factor 2 family protein [Proteobacteria bacterium]|nr:nuclear transport factor 2 family protein [Pseudomonadota bacterium]MDA1291680.1 nuclear transport factor 2 family protein [Pseudomonadota bacterium]
MIKRLLFVVTLSIGLIPASYAADVYRDCANLVTDYAYFRDRFDAAEFSNLFTDEASLSVGNQTWEGRNNIRARIEGLDKSGSIRHLMSTIRIEPIDELHASGVSYATIYTSAAGSNSTEGFALIGEYHDNFELTDDGWKISKCELKSVFSYEDK